MYSKAAPARLSLDHTICKNELSFIHEFFIQFCVVEESKHTSHVVHEDYSYWLGIPIFQHLCNTKFLNFLYG